MEILPRLLLLLLGWNPLSDCNKRRLQKKSLKISRFITSCDNILYQIYFHRTEINSIFTNGTFDQMIRDAKRCRLPVQVVGLDYDEYRFVIYRPIPYYLPHPVIKRLMIRQLESIVPLHLSFYQNELGCSLGQYISLLLMMVVFVFWTFFVLQLLFSCLN